MSIDVGEVAMIPLESIIVEERARKEMGDLNEMEASLTSRGLISPLAVKRLDNGKYKLLAGERRYIILQKHKVPKVPVRIYSRDLTKLEMKSIELAENFFRKNFEYWEYDNLVAEITALQQRIHGEKSPGPSSTGWGLSDTGKVLGIAKSAVSEAIKRADARKAFPQLFEGCKTQRDASKIVNKMSELAVKEALAAKVRTNKASSGLDKLAKTYILGDFFEKIKEVPNEIFHLVEVDPPYAIDLKQQKKYRSNLSAYNEIPADEYQTFVQRTLHECYRVMSKHSWLIFWFAPEPWSEFIYNSIISAGFNTTRLCGIWTKPNGQSLHPDIYLTNAYESFYYAWKGRPALNKPGRLNIFSFSPIPASKKTHPTERPIELMQEIYDTFAPTGSRVLIPFLGSGNGLLAAYNLNMSPVGYELSKEYQDSFLVKIHSMKVRSNSEQTIGR